MLLSATLALLSGKAVLSQSPATGPQPAKTTPPVRLTNEQQRAMGAALNEYRNARKDNAKRVAAVDAAIALGSERLRGCKIS